MWGAHREVDSSKRTMLQCEIAQRTWEQQLVRDCQQEFEWGGGAGDKREREKEGLRGPAPSTRHRTRTRTRSNSNRHVANALNCTTFKPEALHTRHWMSNLSCCVLHFHPQKPHTAIARAAKLAPDAAPPEKCEAAAAAAADQLPKGSACVHRCRLVRGELQTAAALGKGKS